MSSRKEEEGDGYYAFAGIIISPFSWILPVIEAIPYSSHVKSSLTAGGILFHSPRVSPIFLVPGVRSGIMKNIKPMKEQDREM